MQHSEKLSGSSNGIPGRGSANKCMEMRRRVLSGHQLSWAWGMWCGLWKMRLETQAVHEGPVGQANELGAAPTGNRTTEGFQTGKQHGRMCIEGRFLERADAQWWAVVVVWGEERGRLACCLKQTGGIQWWLNMEMRERKESRITWTIAQVTKQRGNAGGEASLRCGWQK